MSGEYTDVQLNWILNENGIDRERLDSVSDWIAYSEPLSRAAKFLFIYAVAAIALRTSLHLAGLL